MSFKVTGAKVRFSFVFVAAILAVVTAQAGEQVTPSAAQPPLAPVARAIEPAVAPQVSPAIDPRVEVLVPDAEPACDDDSTPVDAVESVATPVATTSSTQAASCKPCKDRTWCKCTYNGLRRASCNPCCYVNDIGVYTCLD